VQLHPRARHRADPISGADEGEQGVEAGVGHPKIVSLAICWRK
jgi:hypothetical protein